jgi:hypothetical protein
VFVHGGGKNQEGAYDTAASTYRACERKLGPETRRTAPYS